MSIYLHFERNYYVYLPKLFQVYVAVLELILWGKYNRNKT